MKLLFGMICRLLVRACYCAADVLEFRGSPKQTDHLFMLGCQNFQGMFKPWHRIALAPIIIAQPALIQTQGATA